jgi:hypothetical protein
MCVGRRKYLFFVSLIDMFVMISLRDHKRR